MRSEEKNFFLADLRQVQLLCGRPSQHDHVSRWSHLWPCQGSVCVQWPNKQVIISIWGWKSYLMERFGLTYIIAITVYFKFNPEIIALGIIHACNNQSGVQIIITGSAINNHGWNIRHEGSTVHNPHLSHHRPNQEGLHFWRPVPVQMSGSIRSVCSWTLQTSWSKWWGWHSYKTNWKS